MGHSGGGSTGPGLSLQAWTFYWDNYIFLLNMSFLPYHTWPLLLWHLQGTEAYSCHYMYITVKLTTSVQVC